MSEIAIKDQSSEVPRPQWQSASVLFSAIDSTSREIDTESAAIFRPQKRLCIGTVHSGPFVPGASRTVILYGSPKVA